MPSETSNHLSCEEIHNKFKSNTNRLHYANEHYNVALNNGYDDI